MKSSRVIVLVAISFALLSNVSGQGFVNLDFEDATIAPTPVGGSTYPADPTQCFPGWTVGGYGTVVMYNDLSIGAPVCLMGPSFPNFPNYAPLQGSYSVLLQYFASDILTPPTLSQTGLVPAGTESINFLAGPSRNDAVVSLNGVNIPLTSISGGRLAGDVSAFAGTVAQLAFSTTSSTSDAGNWLYFDDIQFSSSTVPEPRALSLFVVFFLVFCWQRTRSNNTPEQTAAGCLGCSYSSSFRLRLSFFR